MNPSPLTFTYPSLSFDYANHFDSQAGVMLIRGHLTHVQAFASNGFLYCEIAEQIVNLCQLILMKEENNNPTTISDLKELIIRVLHLRAYPLPDFVSRLAPFCELILRDSDGRILIDKMRTTEVRKELTEDISEEGLNNILNDLSELQRYLAFCQIHVILMEKLLLRNTLFILRYSDSDKAMVEDSCRNLKSYQSDLERLSRLPQLPFSSFPYPRGTLGQKLLLCKDLFQNMKTRWILHRFFTSRQMEEEGVYIPFREVKEVAETPRKSLQRPNYRINRISNPLFAYVCKVVNAFFLGQIPNIDDLFHLSKFIQKSATFSASIKTTIEHELSGIVLRSYLALDRTGMIKATVAFVDFGKAPDYTGGFKKIYNCWMVHLTPGRRGQKGTVNWEEAILAVVEKDEIATVKEGYNHFNAFLANLPPSVDAESLFAPRMYKVFETKDRLEFVQPRLKGDFEKIYYFNDEIEMIDYMKIGLGAFLNVCRATKLMHEMGYVHRDIKLSNVFITKKNKFVVADFDLMRQEGAVSGGYNYLFSELANLGLATPETDCYQIICMLFYLFADPRIVRYLQQRKFVFEDEYDLFLFFVLAHKIEKKFALENIKNPDRAAIFARAFKELRRLNNNPTKDLEPLIHFVDKVIVETGLEDLQKLKRALGIFKQVHALFKQAQTLDTNLYNYAEKAQKVYETSKDQRHPNVFLRDYFDRFREKRDGCDASGVRRDPLSDLLSASRLESLIAEMLSALSD